MLEYGESYLKQNAVILRRYRLELQMHDKLHVYRLMQEMAREQMAEDDAEDPPKETN